jgi:hypothetical protein
MIKRIDIVNSILQAACYPHRKDPSREEMTKDELLFLQSYIIINRQEREKELLKGGQKKGK